MRVCVVGSGPSAEGQGEIIDACDFVVRVKSWWAHGAENAGEKVDAWAWFGADRDTAMPIPKMDCEHWFTICSAQYPDWPELDTQLEAFSRESHDHTRQYLSNEAWRQARDYFGGPLSMGFIAVVMALDVLFKPHRLLLIGFDSTTPDKPGFNNARRDTHDAETLDYQKEKQVLAELHQGLWLGQPIGITLEWIGEPDHA